MQVALGGFEYIVDPNRRLYWLYLLSSFALALIWSVFHKSHRKIIFSRAIWLHPSARLDYIYFVVVFFIKIFLIIPLIISAKSVAFFMVEFLFDNFGLMQPPKIPHWFVLYLFTTTLFIVSDFSRYWLHRWLHTIPFLWEIHKIHHSARVLTPFTFYRIHPIENLLFGIRYSLVVGFVTGIFFYIFGARISVVDILGVNLFVFAFSLLGSNLRHSHVPFSYPKFFEKWFISPRQHQIHHSFKYSKFNYGGYLAVWDRIFNTLVLSANVERIKFGLRPSQMESYKTVGDLLFAPFKYYKGKFMKTSAILSSVIVVFFLGCVKEPQKAQLDENLQASLGEILFFDPNLSKNRTQSCSTCHNPETAFVDLRDNGIGKMVSLGDDGVSLGDRQAPTASYAKFSPPFHYDEEKKAYVGGQFWDGREEDLAGQAGGPPLNPIEMGMPDKASIIERIKENSYYVETMQKLYGNDIFKDIDKAYLMMTKSIEAYEKTDFFAPFDSKYDRYLKGEYELTPLEDLGRSLFFSNNNTNCSTCHMLKTEDMPGETFTNYEYRNIGTPENHLVRQKNGSKPGYKDDGLLANPKVDDINQRGKYKVPTLRNVAVTGPYMHNGIFKDLKTVIEFYDKYNNSERDINPETGKKWADAEIKDTISVEELKAKKLTDRKVDALVAFLKLLTDKRYEHLLKE